MEEKNYMIMIHNNTSYNFHIEEFKKLSLNIESYLIKLQFDTFENAKNYVFKILDTIAKTINIYYDHEEKLALDIIKIKDNINNGTYWNNAYDLSGKNLFVLITKIPEEKIEDVLNG